MKEQKSLNRSCWKDYLMQKRGQIEVVGLAIIIIIVTSIGAYSILSQANHIYVGDKVNKLVYDYYKCKDKVDKIIQNNQIIFSTLKNAQEWGYEIVKECI